MAFKSFCEKKPAPQAGQALGVGSSNEEQKEDSAHGLDGEFREHVMGKGGGFGVFVLFMNMVATFLSGFVVIGVADLAKNVSYIPARRVRPS